MVPGQDAHLRRFARLALAREVEEYHGNHGDNNRDGGVELKAIVGRQTRTEADETLEYDF